MTTETLRATIGKLPWARPDVGTGVSSEEEADACEVTSDGTSESLASDREEQADDIFKHIHGILGLNAKVRTNSLAMTAPDDVGNIRNTHDDDGGYHRFGSWTKKEEDPTARQARWDASPYVKRKRAFDTLTGYVIRSGGRLRGADVL
jgi:hypothetical protein